MVSGLTSGAVGRLKKKKKKKKMMTNSSLVNQPVFLRMREGEKNSLAKLARFLKSLGMCNGILAPINCMRA